MNESTAQNPLGTKSIKKLLISLAWPAITANIVNALYSIVDQIFIGQGVGYLGNAATNIAFPITTICLAIGLMIGIGAAANFNLELGRGNPEKAKSVVGTSVSSLFLIGIILTILVQIFLEPLMYAFGSTDEILEYAKTFAGITSLGIPFLLISISTNPIVRSDNSPKYSMFGIVFGAVLNMILNPIFIFDVIPFTSISGLGLGVKGAALATVLTQGIMCIVGFIHLRINKDIIKLNLHSLVYIKWEKHILKRIYRITLPSVIGQVGTAIGFMIMNSFIQSYGTETVAAYGMVNRISGLLNIPPGGVGSAITSIIGQNIGNNNIKRVKETFKKASIIIIIMSILIAFISFTFRYEILSFFINAPKESELMIQANSYMFYTLITLVMLNMFFVYQGLFQGSGNSKYSMAIDMIRLWIIRIPLILFFKYFTKQGATGIWLAMAISNILVTIIAHLIYLKGKWQQGSFCR